jgi:eukaryotic-like serine/threonine-protein kinase
MPSTFEPSTFAATTMDSQAGDAGAASYGYLGRYRLDFMIGHGAMGAVFEAFDATLGRTIAIKTLYTQPDQTSGGFDSAMVDAAILQEARAAATLNHPNIVTVYDAGRAPSSMLNRELPYVAMELLQGSDLRQRIAQGPAFAQRDAVALIGKLALALDHAHKNGVIHRDIKPANVFLSKTNVPKILDFGLAKFTARVAHTGQSTHGELVAGSPQYMSPEMLQSILDPKVKPDARSDVYSLGVILYELLCGKPPFAAPTLDLLQARISQGAPDAPHKVNSAIPRDLSDIMLQALSKKPDDRYRSAGQLARELRRWGANTADMDETLAKPVAVAKPLMAEPASAPQAGTNHHINHAMASADGVALASSAEPARLASTPKTTWLWAALATGVVVAGIAWLWQGQQVKVLPPVATQPLASPKTTLPLATSQRLVAAPPALLPAAPSSMPTADTATLAMAVPAVSADVPAAQVPTSAPVAALPVAALPTAASLGPGESISPTESTAGSAQTGATSGDAGATTGKLRISIAPWGKVEVDGKSLGVSPPLTLLSLEPGEHVVVLRNADFAARTFKITVEAGKTQRIAHRFE